MDWNSELIVINRIISTYGVGYCFSNEDVVSYISGDHCAHIAYTVATEQGQQIQHQHVQQYVGRVREPGRSQRRNSDFWLGLYGRLWIDLMNCWANWAQQLMRLKPQKRVFFLRGLKAMSAIQSTF
jgi:hypothetical protein